MDKWEMLKSFIKGRCSRIWQSGETIQYISGTHDLAMDVLEKINELEDGENVEIRHKKGEASDGI